MPRSVLVFVVCLSVAVAAVARPAWAQAQRASDTRTWYQAYQDGRRQIQQGNWQAAIASLQQAKRTGPRPGRRIPFYGDVFDDFLPDYYLGLAYLNAQQYKDATASFEAVRQSGLMTTRDREYAEFTTQSARASTEFEKSRLAQATPPSTKPPTGDAPTQTAAQTTSRGPETPTNPPDGERPDVAQTAAQRPTQAPVQQGSPVTQTAATTAAIATGVVPATPNAAAVLPPTQKAKTPSASSPIGAAGTRRSPLSVDKGVIRNARDDTPPGAIRALLLESALRAFFTGDYPRAYRELTPAPGTTDVNPRVDFYLACSGAALVLTGGVAGEEARLTLEAARTRFARLNAADYAADERYVSPRVLQTLRAQR